MIPGPRRNERSNPGEVASPIALPKYPPRVEGHPVAGVREHI
jgi:hypothetical protein